MNEKGYILNLVVNRVNTELQKLRSEQITAHNLKRVNLKGMISDFMKGGKDDE